MKIVTYNVQFGLGRDGRFDLERIAREVDGADIIALQEVERNWRRSGNVDQPAQLGQFLNKYHWVYGPYFDVDASKSQPDGTIKNIRRQFGNMILSKTPILSTRLFPLPKSALRQRHNMVVGVFEGVVKLNAMAPCEYITPIWERARAMIAWRKSSPYATPFAVRRPRAARGPAILRIPCGKIMGIPYGKRMPPRPRCPNHSFYWGISTWSPKTPSTIIWSVPRMVILADFPPQRNLSIPGSRLDMMKMRGLPIPPTLRQVTQRACASIMPSSTNRWKSGSSGRGLMRRLKGRTINPIGSTSIMPPTIRRGLG